MGQVRIASPALTGTFSSCYENCCLKINRKKLQPCHNRVSQAASLLENRKLPGKPVSFPECHDDDTRTEGFEDTGCFWTSWPVFCTTCQRISLCPPGSVYSSDSNLKTPLRKTTEPAKGKEPPFEGPHSKQHFLSLHSLPAERGWFLTQLQMLFFTPREC